jgi:hypothetical protein
VRSHYNRWISHFKFDLKYRQLRWVLEFARESETRAWGRSNYRTNPRGHRASRHWRLLTPTKPGGPECIVKSVSASDRGVFEPTFHTTLSVMFLQLGLPPCEILAVPFILFDGNSRAENITRRQWPCGLSWAPRDAR